MLGFAIRAPQSTILALRQAGFFGSNERASKLTAMEYQVCDQLSFMRFLERLKALNLVDVHSIGLVNNGRPHRAHHRLGACEGLMNRAHNISGSAPSL